MCEMRPEPVERTHHGADRGGGDAGVERGGVELGMAQQNLDHPDVDVLLQQRVTGKNTQLTVTVTVTVAVSVVPPEVTV